MMAAMARGVEGPDRGGSRGWEARVLALAVRSGYLLRGRNSVGPPRHDRRRMRRARCLALAAVMLLAGALPGGAEPLRLLVDTAYQPHHVPILIAALRGHFQREGIELLLEPGLGPNRMAVLVGQRAFDMGHVSAPAAAAAIAAGDAVTLGKAAAESQAMAETVLRNQVPETTALVRALLEAGAFAASSFGAGFGGAVWGVIGAYAHDSFDLIARVCGVNSRWSDFMEPSRGMATG